jgi:hypothetical protein
LVYNVYSIPQWYRKKFIVKAMMRGQNTLEKRNYFYYALSINTSTNFSTSGKYEEKTLYICGNIFMFQIMFVKWFWYASYKLKRAVSQDVLDRSLKCPIWRSGIRRKSKIREYKNH